MNVHELLARLSAGHIKIAADGDQLVLKGPREALDASLLARIQEHKQALIGHCRHLLPAGADVPLVDMSAQQRARLAAAVDGGADAIEDVYPLSPLQEGMVFHHTLHPDGDPYILRSMLAFDTPGRRDAFLAALQQVIDRHDILRSSFHWEGLAQPVQVVHRQATLTVQTVDAGDGDALQALRSCTEPAVVRLELRRAPLVRAVLVPGEPGGECLLAVLFHHLVCDHVSLNLVLAEIEAILQGKPAGRPPLPYRAFIAATLATPPAAHEDYFRRQLGAIDQPTAPFGLLDVQQGTHDLHEAVWHWEGDDAARLRECARLARVTPAALFHTGWALVLAKLCGQDTVVFGTVLSGRLQGTAGADRAVGMFLNTLPVRLSLAERTVAQSLAAMQQALGELLPHEQASLALAQRCSAVEPGLPLFTTALNYRHNGRPGAGGQGQAGWEGIRQLESSDRSNYPLGCIVDDWREGFTCKIQCVEAVDRDRVLAYMRTALASLTDAMHTQPDRPTVMAGVLPAAERHLLLNEFNTAAPVAQQASLFHRLFEQRAATNPDAPALDDGSTVLSYATLNGRANRLAHHLIALGVRPDDRVALYLKRGIEMVVALLGTLKAGAAYVPLDTAAPEARLRAILDECAPVALLTQDALQEDLPALSLLRVLVLDDPRGAAHAHIARQPGHDPAPSGLHARSLAYLIYTSGSTGAPKGVMLEHGGLANLASAQIAMFGLKPGDQVLQFAALGFDASVWEIAMSLGSGACLHVASDEALRPGKALLDTLQSRRITHVTLPSSVLAVMPEALDRARMTVIVAGEAFPPVLARQWASRHHVINAYGPTEATVCASAFVCDTEARNSTPIGRPIANTRIYLLDAHLQPVPLGVAGELYIGGAGVARGYLNRAEQTAERFLPDPFGAGPDARMYKTGDLARYRADGVIEYLGRNDFQVKIRGVRIEPGEIEARLTACDGVRQAVVLAREDQPGDVRLVAYLVHEQPGHTPDALALRASLRRTLPEYMLPAHFVAVPAIPLTPNGKLDRKALPAPDGRPDERGYVAPTTPAEQRLCKIFAETLKFDRVGIHDNFFDVGGHSLLAMHLIGRINAEFERTVALQRIFEAPTVAQLARVLGPASAAGAGDTVKPSRLVWD